MIKSDDEKVRDSADTDVVCEFEKLIVCSLVMLFSLLLCDSAPDLVANDSEVVAV